MKKLIAILAAIVAVSGVGAFGQDWITFEVSSKTVWDNFGSKPTFDAGGAGTIDAILLYSTSDAADNLPSVSGLYGLRGTGTALDQVATNATSATSPVSVVNAMLSSGWSIAADANNAGATAVATEATGLAAGQVGYDINGGLASPFQVTGITGASGSTIEVIVLAYNASAGSWSTASDYGWSNPFQTAVGTSSGDPNADSTQSSANQFGVAAVPEPTTLVLAGLGGLSMLGLRRRKA